MSVCVFLGPSLARAEAEAILPATYLPPARRGDIRAAVEAHGAATVLLIDGLFEQVPSVWHKEILWALDRGVAVWGAASMGALRAAELAQFGMAGFGAIFEAYASARFPPFDGPFEDDDEVAVVHGPEGLEGVATTAMVDIRADLVGAEAAGAIDAATRAATAAAAKALFYKDRTWRRVYTVAAERGVAPAALVRLEDWRSARGGSLKARDAAGLLAHVAAGARPPPPPPFRFERTLIWEMAEARRGDRL